MLTGLSTLKLIRLLPDALAPVGPTGDLLVFCLFVFLFFFFVFFSFLQHFSNFLLSSPHRCFISVFVSFLCSGDELGTLQADWTKQMFVYSTAELRARVVAT